MSIRKAQKIANQIDLELGINLAAYQNSELEWLKSQLEEFLDLEVETEELSDADDSFLDEVDEDEECFLLQTSSTTALVRIANTH